MQLSDWGRKLELGTRTSGLKERRQRRTTDPEGQLRCRITHSINWSPGRGRDLEGPRRAVGESHTNYDASTRIQDTQTSSTFDRQIGQGTGWRKNLDMMASASETGPECGQ